jgi:glyoxylase-like metal-dependent hydrolase (beta-lactamase superfamily II)
MPEAAAWWWYVHAGHPALRTAKLELSGGLRWFDEYFVVAELDQNTFAIGEPRYGQCNFAYLIVGSERALLFDTGPGVRNIATVVHALTALPVMALPSHLHFDHVGNLSRFNDVALPDLPALRAQVHGGVFSLGLYQFLGFVEGFRRPDVRVTRWISPGSDIDLGGRHLRLIGAAGHTPESVVLLDGGTNRVYAGDFIYPSQIYAFLPGADLRDYAESARRVARLLDDASVVYGGHGCDQLPTVGIPVLRKSDVIALAKALAAAGTRGGATATGWYPREIVINDRMRLLAKYPWMRP